MIRALLVTIALFFTGLPAAWSQGLAGPRAVEWSALAAPQRAALAPLERDWSNITPGQQQKWIEVANRFGSMPPNERARTQERMGAWSRLPPQERARARLNYQEARQLSREGLQQQWEAYRSLAPEQRRELAQKAAPPPAPRAAERPSPSKEASEKSSLVRAPVPARARTVGPTVVQRGSGATTNLVSKPAQPPLHQQAGLPKLAATPGFVDSASLLPQRGAQGAAARSTPRQDRKAGNDSGK